MRMCAPGWAPSSACHWQLPVLLLLLLLSQGSCTRLGAQSCTDAVTAMEDSNVAVAEALHAYFQVHPSRTPSWKQFLPCDGC